MTWVLSDTGWRLLHPEAPAPLLSESRTLHIDGLAAGARVGLGPIELVADADGAAAVRLLANPLLGGHVGLVEVTVDGAVAGEVEIVPDKMSTERFDLLRAELQATWLGLVDEIGGVGARRGSLVDEEPPAAVDLWRRIERPVRAIKAEPRFELVAQTTVGRLERVRRPSEISPALIRAHQRSRPGPTQRLVASTAIHENALVADTLRRLGRLAAGQSDAGDVMRSTALLLSEPPFRECGPLRPTVTWGMRCDPRYRQVHAVHRLLSRRRQIIVEGPGVLRLGVRSLPRLYEYWVFLQVLVAAQERYGPPLSGLKSLTTRIGPDHIRVELVKGVSVEFPGDVVVAFEPTITSSGRGPDGLGLELVPHPDPARARLSATPDVVVLRRSPQPDALVIDAKYVARWWVERSAAAVHEKYSRIRLHGTSVVSRVLVAHPHAGFAASWAGYGHLPFVPGEPLPRPPLPVRIRAETAATIAPDPLATKAVARPEFGLPVRDLSAEFAERFRSFLGRLSDQSVASDGALAFLTTFLAADDESKVILTVGGGMRRLDVLQLAIDFRRHLGLEALARTQVIGALTAADSRFVQAGNGTDPRILLVAAGPLASAEATPADLASSAGPPGPAMKANRQVGPPSAGERARARLGHVLGHEAVRRFLARVDMWRISDPRRPSDLDAFLAAFLVSERELLPALHGEGIYLSHLRELLAHVNGLEGVVVAPTPGFGVRLTESQPTLTISGTGSDERICLRLAP